MQNNSLWSDALRRLLANRAAMISAVILTLLILSAIFAPFIATHSYAYQNLSLGATAPSAEHFLGRADLRSPVSFRGACVLGGDAGRDTAFFGRLVLG